MTINLQKFSVSLDSPPARLQEMETSSLSRGLLKAAHNGQDPGNPGGAQGHDRGPDEVAISGSPISSHCTLVGQKKKKKNKKPVTVSSHWFT